MHIYRVFTQLPKILTVIFLILFVSSPNLAWGYSHTPNTSVDALKDSDLVVVARCISTETVFENGQILTVQTFEAQNYIKGYQGAYVTVVQKGGSLGNIQMVVPGSHLMKEGEESVLFLTMEQGGLVSPTYPGAQIPIHRDEYTGQRYVVRSQEGGTSHIQQLDTFVRESIEKINSTNFNEGNSLHIKEMGRLEYHEGIITENNQ